ncbi:GtrA family protein [Pleomorphomonas sp. PLEO]|uniref:GtrA family protein n=1 Tax=Pleomorphomonas sp. PLEO TaxID=3239306 RepID=UPI00351EB71A
MLSREFLRFLMTGGVAAIVNLGSRYGLSYFVRFEIAVVLAYLLGMLTAYVLARIFVFVPSGRSLASELWRFTMVNLVSLAMVWSISVALARIVFPAIGFIWHPEDVAHVIGVLAPAVVSYFGHRFYTFARDVS